MSTTTRKTTKPTDAPVVLTLDADLSVAVKAIETGYRMIQRRHADVPAATIVIKRDQRAWGHTTVAHVWSHAEGEQADRLEIMVSGENLARGARHVAATLLHEAAHARNLAAGVIDTDTNGRHNQRFKASAEVLGLTVEADSWHGFTVTSLTDEQAEAWRQLIATIDRGLTKSAKAHRLSITRPTSKPGAGAPAGTVVVVPPKRGNRNLLKAVCACGYSIRVSQGALDAARPRCSVCRQVFAPVS